MNLKEKYDVVIIGAGLGGLTAGIYLASSGLSVLIVEKHYHPGGYATNFKRNGFTFDASLHLLDGCRDNEYFGEILKELDLKNELQFYRLSPFIKQIYPGFSFSINSDFETFKEDIIREFPSEKKGFLKLINQMGSIYNEARIFYNNPLKYSDFYTMIKHFKTLTKYAKLSAYDLMKNFIKDEKLIEIISQLWFFYGLPVRELSCIYFSFPFITFIKQGCYYVKGGAGTLSNVFAKKFMSFGGTLLLNHEATKIKIDGRKVAGVIIKDENYIKSNVIISNINPKTTFINLIGDENLPGPFAKKILRLKESISAFQVYIGLNESLSKKGIFDNEIIVNENYDSSKAFKAILSGNYKDSPFAIGIYENKDPDFVPDGKSVLNIFMPEVYDNWIFKSKREYINKKNRINNLLIKKAGKYINNLSKMIDTIESATPLTMERYTGNSKGAIHGYSQTNNQSGAGRLNVITPVENLFLTGAWTRPGGGFSTVIMSGRLCSTIVKSRIKIS